MDIPADKITETRSKISKGIYGDVRSKIILMDIDKKVIAENLKKEGRDLDEIIQMITDGNEKMSLFELGIKPDLIIKTLDENTEVAVVEFARERFDRTLVHYEFTLSKDEDPENPREWDNIGTMVYAHGRYTLGDKQEYNSDDVLTNIADDLGIDTDAFNEGEMDEQEVILPLYLYDHSGITMNTTGFSDRWDSGQVGFIYASKQKLIDETGYTEDELFGNDPKREPVLNNHVKVDIEGFRDSGYGKITAIDGGGDSYTVNFDHNKHPDFQKPENVVTVKREQISEVMSNRAKEMLKGEVESFDNYLTGEVYRYNLNGFDRSGNELFEDNCGGFFGDDLEKNGMFSELPNNLVEQLKAQGKVQAYQFDYDSAYEYEVGKVADEPMEREERQAQTLNLAP